MLLNCECKGSNNIRNLQMFFRLFLQNSQISLSCLRFSSFCALFTFQSASLASVTSVFGFFECRCDAMNNVSNGAYKYCEYYYILYCHSVVQLYLIKKLPFCIGQKDSTVVLSIDSQSCYVFTRQTMDSSSLSRSPWHVHELLPPRSRDR